MAIKPEKKSTSYKYTTVIFWNNKFNNNNNNEGLTTSDQCTPPIPKMSIWRSTTRRWQFEDWFPLVVGSPSALSGKNTNLQRSEDFCRRLDFVALGGTSHNVLGLGNPSLRHQPAWGLGDEPAPSQKTLAHWGGKMGIGIEKCHQHLTTRKLRGGSWACRCPAAASSNLAGSRRGAAAACSPRRRINMSPPWWRTGALEHWGAPHLRGKACTSLANTSLFFLFFKLDI